MNWLDDREQEFKKNNDEILIFKQLLSTALDVFKKASALHASTEPLFELRGKRFSSEVWNWSEKKRYRKKDDLVIEDYKRMLKIEHSEDSNYITLRKSKNETVKYYNYNDNENTIELSYDIYTHTLLETSVTDAQLKAITYEEWVTICGWLVNKVSLEEAVKNLDKENRYNYNNSDGNSPKSSLSETTSRSSPNTDSIGAIIGFIVGGIIGFIIYILLALVVEIGSLFIGYTDAQVDVFKFYAFFVLIIGSAILGSISFKDT